MESKDGEKEPAEASIESVFLSAVGIIFDLCPRFLFDRGHIVEMFFTLNWCLLRNKQLAVLGCDCENVLSFFNAF